MDRTSAVDSGKATASGASGAWWDSARLWWSRTAGDVEKRSPSSVASSRPSASGRRVRAGPTADPPMTLKPRREDKRKRSPRGEESLVNDARLRAGLGGEAEPRLFPPRPEDARGRVFTQGGPVLEAVPGAAADQPDVLPRRVPVDEEVAVGRVLVLTHLGRDQGRVLQRREPPGQERAGGGDPLRADPALARVRIEARPVRVRRELEPPRLDVGDAVDLVHEVDPGREGGRREARVPRGRTEVEDLLARGEDAVGEEIREELAQPAPGGEAERPCA